MTRCFRSDCIHNTICNRNNDFICEIENIDQMNGVYGSCRYFESRDYVSRQTSYEQLFNSFNSFHMIED